MNYIKIISLIFPAFIAYFAIEYATSYEHTVVIDPGHGGLSLNPVSMHGDKYDPGQKKYLSPYYQGAAYKNLNEGEIVFNISKKAYDYLKLTQSSGGRSEFEQILRKYGIETNEKIKPVGIFLSRSEGYTLSQLKKYDGKTDKDYNADYRLFDYPDFETGKRMPGIISRINEKKPSLVVSIHLDSIGPPKGAMAAVVTPGYDTFKKAVLYTEGDQAQRRQIYREFARSPYANWIQMDSSRNAFEWFLCDSWIYFTGYWSKKNGLSAEKRKFRGIRQDYVLWNYQGDSWEKRPFEPLVSEIDNVDLEQSFWLREQSEPEKWRREGGAEGIGGDNLYASHELLRYIRLGLLQNKSLEENKLPPIREPHWSTWSLPTYLNAVNAFIEIGFINNRYDRERITQFQDVHAEALAVGIYSLLYGLKTPELKPEDMPKGEPLDLQKYKTWQGLNYFEQVK
jgi:N-acetylmuramoyl-L-alanine amidase